MSLLSVQDVSISFGGIHALDRVTLELNRGEILGLIGPNGAGKTTLFNCISGVLRPDRGRIRFEDRSILRLYPHERARRGIARTFQDLQLWGTMTVLENCKLPVDALLRRNMIFDAVRAPWSTRAERMAEERARAVLHTLNLTEYAEVLAGDLSVGLQRRVELARALCMKPKLLLLDEPASGLDAHETIQLADTLARLRDRFKVSMLLVDHDMSLVMRACHYIYVLDFGELIAAGRPDQVRDDPKVITAYLGEDKKVAEAELKATAATNTATARVAAAAVAPPGPKPGVEPLLRVSGLRAGYGHIEVIRDIDLEVGHGEVVACIGANGAGKTTLLRALSGLIRPSKGSVMFEGVDITRRPAESIVQLGMIHIPQGRGLFPRLTVQETLQLASYSGAHDGFDAAFDVFPVLKRRSGQLVGTLSGGEQQMVALARALLVKPKLMLLDEMSQGLAPAVVQQLFSRVQLFQQQGIAIFLVEQFVESALSVADRAYIFEQGRVSHQGPASVLRKDQTLIESSYLGTAAGVTAAAPTTDGSVVPSLLEDFSVRLPAEIKRGIEERARREGRNPADLLMDLLGTERAKGGQRR